MCLGYHWLALVNLYQMDSKCTTSTGSFEWLLEVDIVIKELFSIIKDQLHIKPNDSIVIPGCGTSALSAALHQNYYKNVISLDNDIEIIRTMSERHKEHDGLVFKYADLAKPCSEVIPDHSVDLVVDKSTLDCMMCSDHGANDLCETISRMLGDDGYYIIITLHDSIFLLSFLTIWFELYKSKQVVRDNGQKNTHILILRKRRQSHLIMNTQPTQTPIPLDLITSETNEQADIKTCPVPMAGRVGSELTLLSAMDTMYQINMPLLTSAREQSLLKTWQAHLSCDTDHIQKVTYLDLKQDEKLSCESRSLTRPPDRPTDTTCVHHNLNLQVILKTQPEVYEIIFDEDEKLEYSYEDFIQDIGNCHTRCDNDNPEECSRDEDEIVLAGTPEAKLSSKTYWCVEDAIHFLRVMQ